MKKKVIFFLFIFLFIFLLILLYLNFKFKDEFYNNILNFDLRDDKDNSKKDLINIEFDIENKEILNYFKKFDSVLKQQFLARLSNFSKYYNIIVDILIDQGLSEEFIYLAYIESEFKTYALSRANASGLWQFMDYTGSYLGMKNNRFVDERRNIIISTIGFTKHFKYLYKYYKGNLELALAAYNCGHGKLDSIIKAANTRNYWELSKMNLLPKETKEYVPKFLGLVLWTRRNNLKIKSIVENESFYIIFKVKKNINFLELKNNLNILELIKEYNPHLKGDIIPEGTILVINYNSILNSNYQNDLSSILSKMEILSMYFPKKSIREKGNFFLTFRYFNSPIKNLIIKTKKE